MKTLRSILSASADYLFAEATVSQALKQMTESGISSVIIVEDENLRPIGIFTEHDALKIVANKISTDTVLGDVMTSNPFCISELMQLNDAYRTMEEKGFRHLIVVDESGQFVGVVTEGDFLRHMGFEHLAKSKTVSEAMNESALIIEPNMSLVNAAALMRERKCDYAVVLEGVHPVGLISERDIVRHCVHAAENEYETVAQILRKEFYTIEKNTMLQEAALLMEQHGIHQLIVLDFEGNLAGLLSRHDVLHAAHGAYFEFLLRTIDEKSDAIAKVKILKNELQEEKEAIKNSELKLRKLFEALPDGVVLLDALTMKAVEFNRAAHENLGYTAEEFATLLITDYNAVELPEETHYRIEAILQTGKDSFETLHRMKSGELLNVFVSVISIRFSEHPYMIAVYRDITAQKQSEAVLKQQQLELMYQSVFSRTLLDNIPELIFSKDLNGNYLACNTMFEKFFGAKESEIIGKTDFDFVDADLAQFFRDNDKSALELGKPRNNEEYLKFSDGGYEGVFEVTKVPMKDRSERVIGLLGIGRDITSRKEYEK